MENISVHFNEFQTQLQPHTSFIKWEDGDFSELSLLSNIYSDDGRNFIAGESQTEYTFSEWKSMSGETGSRILNSNYFDASRDIRTYLAVTNLKTGDVFSDPGVSAFDNVDGDISATVTISTNPALDMSSAGTYVLEYGVSEQSGNSASPVTRTIHVTEGNPPVITLTPPLVMTNALGEAFVDPGYAANDNESGDLTTNVQRSSTPTLTVNFSGVYTLSYDVSDPAGNAAETKTRTLIITNNDGTIGLPPDSFVDHDVTYFQPEVWVGNTSPAITLSAPLSVPSVLPKNESIATFREEEASPVLSTIENNTSRLVFKEAGNYAKLLLYPVENTLLVEKVLANGERKVQTYGSENNHNISISLKDVQSISFSYEDKVHTAPVPFRLLK